MATTTPNFGWSVPTSTDYVKDGATAIETLGDAIDARIGNVCTYPNQLVNVVSCVSRPVAYAMASGLAACGANAGVTITYPSGRFTQTPLLATSCVDVTTYATNEVVTGRTGTTSFSAYSYAGACSIHYIAVQMTSAASAG
jgi:hypothetical protein